MRLATILRESDDLVVEGVLHCTNPNCQHEFPIIDGIPVILSSLRDYVGNNVLPILARSDLHSTTQSLLSDCLGPGSALDSIRYQLSCYSWEHYGRYDPQEQGTTLQPRATFALLRRGIEMCGTVPEGVVFDVGCGVGGMTFATAELSNSLVLGIDVNFGMLRLAQQVLRTGQVSYPRRRIGVVYDQREFSIPQTNFENVDFWACDATALPFPKSSANFVTALNILDCVSSPINLLTSSTAVLVPGGRLIAATPYDWSAGVTPFETWLGGHSQRGGDSGAGEPLLRKLLTPGGHPCSIAGLELVAEDQNVPWTVRLHDRSTMSYLVHLIIAQRRE